jgi:hypothetical protein
LDGTFSLNGTFSFDGTFSFSMALFLVGMPLSLPTFSVEYCAASDALTFAPEGFTEFFKQRQRWIPSTMANIIDLLRDYRNVVKVNESVSIWCRLLFPVKVGNANNICRYIAYQLVMLFSSVLGPGTIFLMVRYSGKKKNMHLPMFSHPDCGCHLHLLQHRHPLGPADHDHAGAVLLHLLSDLQHRKAGMAFLFCATCFFHSISFVYFFTFTKCQFLHPIPSLSNANLLQNANATLPMPNSFSC